MSIAKITIDKPGIMIEIFGVSDETSREIYSMCLRRGCTSYNETKKQRDVEEGKD